MSVKMSIEVLGQGLGVAVVEGVVNKYNSESWGWKSL